MRNIRSFTLRDRVAGLDPVVREIVRQQQDFQMRESHRAKSFERRADIRAMCQRTTAAVHDEFGRPRERLSPFLEVGHSLRVNRRTMKRSAGHVRTFVQRTEANANDDRVRAVLGQFLRQRRGLNPLLGSPRCSRIVRLR